MHAHAFAGAIKDSLLEEYDIAQFLLAIVNSGKEYRKWESLNKPGDNFSCGNTITFRGQNNKSQYASDHTQVSAAKEFRAQVPSSCSLVSLSCNLSQLKQENCYVHFIQFFSEKDLRFHQELVFFLYGLAAFLHLC